MKIGIKEYIKEKLKKYPKIFDFFSWGLQNTTYLFRKILSFAFFFRKIEKSKIVFSNFHGNGFGGNGKAIVEELLKSSKDYDIVWMLNKKLMRNNNLPKKVRTVEIGSLKSLYELTTAKIWVDNCRKTFYPYKRKKQFYIQTWHGGLGIKKIDGDAIESVGNYYVRAAKKDSKMADILISNSKHLTNIYNRAFWYSGEILECGYPQNDVFFVQERINKNKNKVKKYYGLKENIKILLYAPTFRVDYNTNVYDMCYKKILEVLEKKDNEEWVIMIRLHPNIAKFDDKIEHSRKVISATNYPDMEELVTGCDMLISDYSSCIFDGAMLKIPTFIYASDANEYMNERGTYFQLEELPFPLAKNTKALEKIIINFNQDEYENEVKKFNEKVGLKDDGNASKKVVNLIEKVINCK